MTLSEAHPDTTKLAATTPPRVEDLCSFFEGMPAFTTGLSRVTPVVGDQVSPSMLAFLDSAKHSIDIDIYSLKAPVVKDLILRKCGEGVKVRILTSLSGTSSEKKALGQQTVDELTAAGAQVLTYPVARALSQANHPKLATVDRLASMISTRNWGSTFGKNRDLDVVYYVTGSLCEQGQYLFEGDWAYSGGHPREVAEPVLDPRAQLVASAPMASHTARTLGDEIERSRSMEISLRILTDKSLLKKLESALERGADVRLLMGDTRQNLDAYQRLSAAGAHIRVLQPALGAEDVPAQFREKYAIFDGRRVHTGSSDWSSHCLYLNRELDVYFDLPELARHMSGHFCGRWDAAPEEPSFRSLEGASQTLGDRMLGFTERSPAWLQKSLLKVSGAGALLSLS